MSDIPQSIGVAYSHVGRYVGNSGCLSIGILIFVMSVGGYMGNSVRRSVGKSEIRDAFRSFFRMDGTPVGRYVEYFRYVGRSVGRK